MESLFKMKAQWRLVFTKLIICNKCHFSYFPCVVAEDTHHFRHHCILHYSFPDLRCFFCMKHHIPLTLIISHQNALTYCVASSTHCKYFYTVYANLVCAVDSMNKKNNKSIIFSKFFKRVQSVDLLSYCGNVFIFCNREIGICIILQYFNVNLLYLFNRCCRLTILLCRRAIL